MTLTQDLPFTLRQLQYAIAVAELRSFGEAARRCGVSQPSLSAQVAKLEDMLGVVLFERLPRDVQPTEEGRELLPELRRLLSRAVELSETAARLSDPSRAVLRIGVIPTVAPYLLPELVPRLLQEMPGLSVLWHEARTAELEERVISRDLHAALLGGAPSSTNLVSRPLGREQFALIVPNSAPLSKAPLTLDQLDGARLLLLEEGHCLRDQALDLCMRYDLPEAPYRATSLPTLVQMVGAGLGLTLLPRSALEAETRRAPVHEQPLQDPQPTRTLHLVWHPRARQAELLEQLATQSGAVVAALPQRE